MKEADNLYKLWNRMCSGSYLPEPVRAVEIPKDHGEGVRTLGVPTVGDRVAQTAQQRCCWRNGWSRSSIPTATAIVLGDRLMTLWLPLGTLLEAGLGN
jgi:hypothetical protein